MPDESSLDDCYFVDDHVYNCPFCNRRHVMYSVISKHSFSWSVKQICNVYFVECHSCRYLSMHLTYRDIGIIAQSPKIRVHRYRFDMGEDLKDEKLDDLFFYSVPTSFFVLDERVPRKLRELLTEAEGCLKSNFLTGASACARKMIYELAVLNSIEDENYEERIKSLKKKHRDIEQTYFDTLLTIQKVTSSKVHENSYDGWTSKHVRLILASIREVLRELYVVPALRDDRRREIIELGNELLAVGPETSEE